ncbi:MAG: hypothetical protein IJY24_06960 [Clostridia bacterium]|nr:hypothetical protein [Clostridia bacterium]
MFDKAMFEKVCNLSCTMQELREFNRGLTEREFDLDRPFDRYFSIDTVLRLIKLRRAKRLPCKFISEWAYAYNWIIMGGFKTEINDETVTDIPLKTLIIWEISDYIDSLAFYDADFDEDLEDYVINLRTLDSVYHNEDKWKAYYSYCGGEYDNCEPVNDIALLLVCKSKPVYYTMYSDGCDFKSCRLVGDFEEVDDIDRIIGELKGRHYREL